MNLKELLPGKCWTICGVQSGRDCQVLTFIYSLPEKDQKQTLALLKFRADTAIIHNKEKFKKVAEGIFELKTRNNVRILCFWGKHRELILTRGFMKPPNRVFQQEVKRAQILLQEYKAKADKLT
ncbi:MAG TPA: type II toxin-antitoxin system RelE/ParE family toxin [Syntrophales bacterium]|nr:type II toxin-antitoxin system RelE/ParE family toxin [Syntrophales bacterium]